jgi:hypothetical protein
MKSTTQLLHHNSASILIKASNHQHDLSQSRLISLQSVDQLVVRSASKESFDRSNFLRKTRSGQMKSSTQSIDHEHFYSITEMIFIYAQQAEENKSSDLLENILNILELHFNGYSDQKRQIYFEGIFQILHDFQEPITELVLIETMQKLKVR